MRLIIPSRGRHDYAPTIESIPESVLQHVEVWVPKSEYKLYRKSPLFSGVTVECWPDHIDCIPKKRRWLYENIDGAYMVVDDDLGLKVWSKSHDNYVAANQKPKAFHVGLERTFDVFEHATCVGITNTFMAPMRIRSTKSFDFNTTPYCFAGFAAKRPKLDFKTFFFTDIAMPMQLGALGCKQVTKGMIAYTLRQNKKLQSSGTSVYRNDLTIKFSALSLARQMPGHIFGLAKTGNLGGDWSLKKTFVKPNLEKSNLWLSEFAAQEQLKAFPPLVDLDLRMPMEEIFDTYRKHWERAQRGKGDPLQKPRRGLFNA